MILLLIFGKVGALSERDSRNITVYILSVKEWEGLKDTLQEKVGSVSTKIREYHCKDNSEGRCCYKVG